MAETRTSVPGRRVQRARAGSWIRRWAPELVLGVGVVVQLGFALRFVRGMWFDLDAWGYLVQQPAIPGFVDRVMEPHAGHWSTVTYGLYQTLFALFGMRTYWPYVLVTILAHLAICVLVWWLLVRAGCSRWLATAATWVIIFLGAGAQGFLWDAASPPALSVLFGVVALVVLVRRGDAPATLVVAGLLVLLSVMTSGAGVAAGCFVAVFLLLEGRVRSALWTVGPSAAAFVVWYLAYGHDDTKVADQWVYARLPEYVWTGFTSAFGNASGVPELGAVLLVAVVATTALAPRIPMTLRNLGVAGIAAAILHMSLTGVSRLFFGMETASASRYLYLVLVFFAPAIACCFVALSGLHLRVQRATAMVAAGVLLLAYTGTALAQELDYSTTQRGYSSVWRAWEIGGATAVRHGERIISPHPSVALADAIDFRQIATPRHDGKLPDEEATPQQRLTAEGEFFVGVGTTSYDLFHPADVSFTGGFAGRFRKAAGCNTYQAIDLGPSLELDLGDAGNEIGIRSDSTEITTQLRRNGLLSGTRTWQVLPGDVYIASSAKDADLLVTFNRGGEFTICTN